MYGYPFFRESEGAAAPWRGVRHPYSGIIDALLSNRRGDRFMPLGGSGSIFPSAPRWPSMSGQVSEGAVFEDGDLSGGMYPIMYPRKANGFGGGK